jgi:hypothetical protein
LAVVDDGEEGTHSIMCVTNYGGVGANISHICYIRERKETCTTLLSEFSILIL